jgi:hypothetical protein
VYDLGVGEDSNTYLSWVEAAITILGAGGQWRSQFPNPATWESGGINRQWGQIFALTGSPEPSQVDISLLHSNTLDGGELSNPVTIPKMEILGTMFNARYFQVQITIVDPGEEIHTMVEQPTIKFRGTTYTPP